MDWSEKHLLAAPPGRGTKKSYRGGREALRKVLSDSQWADFEKYRSFREIVHTSDGLPAYPIEFGMGFNGFVQFHWQFWTVPIYFRHVYVRSQGLNGKVWLGEDQIISVLLNVRLLGHEEVEKESFACFNQINHSDTDYRKIVDRTYHLDR